MRKSDEVVLGRDMPCSHPPGLRRLDRRGSGPGRRVERCGVCDATLTTDDGGRVTTEVTGR